MNDFIMMTNSQLSAIRTSVKIRIQCKLAYVPPYEQFNEIKLMQLTIREKCGLSSDEGSLVCVDISEWAGHEAEEYFNFFLKFAYDHRERWKYILTVDNCVPELSRRLFLAIRMYLNGSLSLIDRWSGLSALASSLQQNINIDQKAAALLAELLMDVVPMEYRRDDFLRTLERELNGNFAKAITVPHLREYAENQDSLLSLIIPCEMLKKFFEEKGREIEGGRIFL